MVWWLELNKSVTRSPVLMLNQHDQLVLRLRGLPNWNKVKPILSSSYDLLHLITFLSKFNSYSPKCRWMVANIYRAAKRRVTNPSFSPTEVNNCFSIYQKKKVNFFQCIKKWSEIKLLTRDFVSPAAIRRIVLEFSLRKKHYSLVLYIENNAWAHVNMEFLFECSTR